MEHLWTIKIQKLEQKKSNGVYKVSVTNSLGHVKVWYDRDFAKAYLGAVNKFVVQPSLVPTNEVASSTGD